MNIIKRGLERSKNFLGTLCWKNWKSIYVLIESWQILRFIYKGNPWLAIYRGIFSTSIQQYVKSWTIRCPYELIVVDGFNDGSIQWLIEQKDIITIIQHNSGEWRGKRLTESWVILSIWGSNSKVNLSAC
jgi:hypothetical protein